MKKRNKIRLATFLSAVMVSVSVWGIANFVQYREYERVIRLENERSLSAMCEYLSSMETSLIKSVYATSSSTLGALTSELQRASQGAKQSLSELSSGENSLYNIYKFLSQTGDFTSYLNRKAIKGEEITSEERETLKALSVYAASLSLEFEHMASLLSAEYFSFDKLNSELTKTDVGSESMVSYIDSISTAEEAFGDFPTLIYDGPYSDNIRSKESEMLNSSEEIGIDEAKDIAARLLEIDKRLLVEDNSSRGKLEAYNFRSDLYSISITSHGGYPLEIISDITAADERLSRAEAEEKAGLFLNRAGFPDMVATYYAVNDGICTVNFAYKQNSFICYPDLIKVSVSLTDGSITGFEATDYIMNHTQRDIPDFTLTPNDVIGTLSTALSVKKVSAAVIPTQSGHESYTFELLCEDTDGQDILVYKDISTGDEVDILILLYSDNGTLTK